MSSPLVTVLMPVYNSETFLKEAIESVLSQTFKNFELLIIDDGSTDNSPDIINSYAKKDSRIRVITHSKNEGLINTLNQGIIAAKGTYLARMDADDIARNDRLAKQAVRLDSASNLSMVAGHIRIFDSNTNKEISIWPDELEKNTTTFKDIKLALPKANCIAHPTIMARTDTLRRYGYKEYQAGIEDYDLWLRMVAKGEVIEKIDQVLLDYRYSPTSISGSDADPVRRLLSAKVRFVSRQFLHLNLNGFVLSVFTEAVKDSAKLVRQSFSKLKAKVLT